MRSTGLPTKLNQSACAEFAPQEGSGTGITDAAQLDPRIAQGLAEIVTLKAQLACLTRLMATILPAGPSTPTPGHQAALTIEEACAVLRCGRTALFGLIKVGTIEQAQAAGKQTLVLASSVDAFLAGATSTRARRQRPPKPPSTATAADRAASIRALK